MIGRGWTVVVNGWKAHRHTLRRPRWMVVGDQEAIQLYSSLNFVLRCPNLHLRLEISPLRSYLHSTISPLRIWMNHHQAYHAAQLQDTETTVLGRSPVTFDSSRILARVVDDASEHPMCLNKHGAPYPESYLSAHSASIQRAFLCHTSSIYYTCATYRPL